jgi:hypothetical protein
MVCGDDALYVAGLSRQRHHRQQPRLELERRLESAKRIREQQKSKDAAISSLLKKIDEREASGRQ